MNAEQKDRALAARILTAQLNGAPTTPEDYGSRWYDMEPVAATLRRAQLTLHRWAEEMCNGTIQRADEGGHPFRFNDRGEELYGPIPDRERGALARVEKVCKAAGLFYYHQTDPRGCALFVAAEPLNSQNYSTKGIACL